MAKLERDDSVRRLSDLPPQSNTSGFGSYNQYAIPLVRRQFPQLFASALVGVVPMSSSSSSCGTGNAGKGRKPKKQKSLFSFNPKTQRKIIK